MRRIAPFVLVAGVLVSHDAWADTFSLLGTNAESMAMGGAQTAGPSGASGAFYNPAGLNKAHKQESEFTYMWLRPSLQIDRLPNETLEKYLQKKEYAGQNDEKTSYNVIKFKDEVNDYQERRAERVNLIRGYGIGLVVPLAEERSESKASLGTAIFMPQGPISRFRVNTPETPYFVEFDDRSQRVVINAGLGVDITDRVHVGGGATFLVDIPVDMDVFVPIKFNVLDLVLKKNQSGLNVSITPLAQVEILPVIAPTAGVLWDATDDLSFGASYRDEVKAKITANASLRVETGTGSTTSLPAVIKASSGFSPRQATFGAKYKPTEKLTVYADATWSQWSHYRPPVAEFSVSHIKQLVNELLKGSGIADIGILGESVEVAGQSFPVPTTDEILKLVPDYVRVKYEFKGFRNIWTPHVGASYVLTDEVTLMAGYFYRPTIEDSMGIRVVRTTNFGGNISVDKLNQNTLDNDQHTVSLGASYKYKNYKLVATGVFMKLVEKTVDKENDLTLTFPDESGVQGTQTTAYGYPGYTYGGQVYGGMIQGQLAF
jgi:long-subunit fatty acid transport protein